MKTNIIILLICFALYGCCKDEYKDCELQNTFTLQYKNYRNHNVTLVIYDKFYDIVPNTIMNYTVPIKYEGDIYVMYNGEVLDRMEGRPNACATYNYYQ